MNYTHLNPSDGNARTSSHAPNLCGIYAAEGEYYVGRAPLEKPYLFNEVKSFFRVFGKEQVFEWNENIDPGTHNYELDNRQQSYRFFSNHFDLPIVERRSPSTLK